MVKQQTKLEFLINEYTVVSDHFRSYQKNRLTILLLGVTALGGIMLNAIEWDIVVQIFSLFMLYILVPFLVYIDGIFMRRLRVYTLRLSEIEKDFDIIGHATKRRQDTTMRDATTNSVRSIIHAMNVFVFMFALMIFYYQKTTIHFTDQHRWIGIVLTSVFTLSYFFVIEKKVNAATLQR